MIITNLDNIRHSYGTQTVLDGLSWEIQAGQKVGLVGPNGAGKSTLLKIIAGQLKPDGGFVFRHKEIRIGYLAQEPALDPDSTVWEEMLNASAELVRVEAELRRLEARLADPAVYTDETTLARVLTAHARSQAEFERLDGYRLESRAREALTTLGLAEADFDLPVRALSGGQKKLVGLARLLAVGADPSSSSGHSLLLLDEPDNHLDLAGKAYLERFIAGFPGTVVLRAIAFVILSDRRERRISVSPGDWRFFVAIAPQNDRFRRDALQMRLPYGRPRLPRPLPAGRDSDPHCRGGGPRVDRLSRQLFGLRRGKAGAPAAPAAVV